MKLKNLLNKYLNNSYLNILFVKNENFFKK